MSAADDSGARPVSPTGSAAASSASSDAASATPAAAAQVRTVKGYSLPGEGSSTVISIISIA